MVWRGDYVVFVSQYYDYKNGVDFVLEISQREGVLRIAVDVTSSHDTSVLDAKKARNWLAALKCFVSEAEEEDEGFLRIFRWLWWMFRASAW